MNRIIPLAVMLICLPGAACQTTKVGFPAEADVAASVQPKPRPGAETLEPGGNAKYNEKVEAWGDGISAAAGRICRFLVERGMKADCPPRPAQEQ